MENGEFIADFLPYFTYAQWCCSISSLITRGGFCVHQECMKIKRRHFWRYQIFDRKKEQLGKKGTTLIFCRETEYLNTDGKEWLPWKHTMAWNRTESRSCNSKDTSPFWNGYHIVTWCCRSSMPSFKAGVNDTVCLSWSWTPSSSSWLCWWSRAILYWSTQPRTLGPVGCWNMLTLWQHVTTVIDSLVWRVCAM